MLEQSVGVVLVVDISDSGGRRVLLGSGFPVANLFCWLLQFDRQIALTQRTRECLKEGCLEGFDLQKIVCED